MLNKPLDSALGENHVLVISPVRNEVSRVKSMLNSLMSQNHQKWTVVFGDNASTDGTKEYLLAQQALDSRVIVIAFTSGLPIHQNFRRTIDYALQTSNAEFIQFLAADDELGDSEYFATGISEIRRQNCDILCGSIDAYDGNQILEKRSFEKALVKRSSSSRTAFTVLNYWMCNLIYALYVRKAFEETYKNPTATFTDNLSSDWWFASFAYRAFRVGYSPKLAYKKFQKFLDYGDSHYSLSDSAKRKNKLLGAVTFAFRQIGDRKRNLPMYKQASYVAGFVLRDLIQLQRSLRSKYWRI